MKKLFIALLVLIAGPAFAVQQNITYNARTSWQAEAAKVQSNFSDLYTNKVYGTLTIYDQDTAPAACTVGDIWVDTNGTTGQRLYTCETTNNWVAQVGGSGSMTYPGAGIPASTGSAWTTSYSLVTTVGATGSDASIPSEQAVREAIDALPSLTIQTTSISTGTSNILGSDYGLIADTDGDGLPEKSDSTFTIPDSGKIIFDESATDPNDADIELSATDGVFKIAAANGANNEDITIDLDQTANTAIIGSSTGLTMITTGSIPLTGAINVVAKSSDYTVGTDNTNEAYGTIFFNTAASTRTFTLPGAVAGMNVCFRNAQGVAQIIRVDAASGDYIVKSTGARTSASGEYYGATADAKNQVCLVAYDSTDWYVTSEVGTWAEE